MFLFVLSTAVAALVGAFAALRIATALRAPGSGSWANVTIWWLIAAGFTAQSIALWRRLSRVPSVTGRPYAEAKLLLEEAGLRIRFGREVDDPRAAPEEVLVQDPAPGRYAMKGSDVVVDLPRPKRRR